MTIAVGTHSAIEQCYRLANARCRSATKRRSSETVREQSWSRVSVAGNR